MTSARMHPAVMLLGFTRAVGRFLGGEQTPTLHETLAVAVENQSRPNVTDALLPIFGSREDPPWDLDEEMTSAERYFALFEALNWAVSLDDRLAMDWPFHEIEHGRFWCDEFSGGGLIRGLRFARNSAHHDWSLILDIDPLEKPFQQRIELLWLCWAEGLGAVEEGAGVTAYRDYLAGRAVGDTLFEISKILTAAVNITLGIFGEHQTGPAKIKESARDLYVPDDSTSAK